MKQTHNENLRTQQISLTSDQSALFYEKELLQLYLSQLEHNKCYQNYAQSVLTAPASITTWQDIPALPTDAFKSTNNPSSLTENDRHTTFYTSGTTTETKGAHHFSSTKLYEESILAGWQHCKLPVIHPDTFILTPSAEEAPHSSLSHMMQTLQAALCPSATFILSADELDTSALLQAAKQNKPITLLGTALAFLKLFDALEEPLELHPDSWAMETGGYKGTDKSLTKEELYQLFQDKLKLPSDSIWNEYSMTELSSQFYTQGLGKPHIAPPWTRIKVIHPETGAAVSAGEMGYLVIYDLANVESCLAIRTQDLAIYHDSQSFTLIGRDPSALPRGCSRSILS